MSILIDLQLYWDVRLLTQLSSARHNGDGGAWGPADGCPPLPCIVCQSIKLPLHQAAVRWGTRRYVRRTPNPAIHYKLNEVG